MSFWYFLQRVGRKVLVAQTSRDYQSARLFLGIVSCISLAFFFIVGSWLLTLLFAILGFGNLVIWLLVRCFHKRSGQLSNSHERPD